eukprot:5938282-Ditylum_brightwellii.AAC.1
MICIENKTAEHVAQQFENVWLSCYPCPGKCIHDNRGESISGTFQQMLQQAGIKDAPTTLRNLQASLVCKRLHQTVANISRFTTNGVANMMQQATRAVDNALAIATHATQYAVLRAIGTSPGTIVYHRDMFFNLPVLAYLVTICNHCQESINRNLCQQNLKRHEWNYTVEQEVLIKTVDPTKLQQRAHGPYTIVHIFTNDTMAVKRAPH